MRFKCLMYILALLCITAGVLTGCRSAPLLSGVSVSPDTISPNADGESDVALIKYRLGRSARVSIILIDEKGARHTFRADSSRPPGAYEVLFGGVIDNRLLPDGHYTCVFEAAADDGETARFEQPLILSGGAADYIEIQNLDIYPAVFTPNRDGISDRVTVGYYLTKEATKVQVYLVGSDGQRYPVPEDKIRKMGQVGNHEHDYDAGVDLGAEPPPDGTYTVVVEAEDAIGNRAEARGELRIENGGVPQVEIVNRAAEWSSTVVPLGQTLTFTCTVRNIGRVGVRTSGPQSGSTYTSSENFNTKGFPEEPGVFRIGVDYEGNSTARQYPYRWSLGLDSELTVIDGENYLMPGQTATVVGHVQIIDKPLKIAPYYWIGLIHEQVWIAEDRVEATPITIGF